MQSQLSKMENPIRDLFDLNLRTAKNLHYINPKSTRELQPEKLFENNVDLLIQNSHELLDYWRELFSILNKSFTVSNELLKESISLTGKTPLQATKQVTNKVTPIRSKRRKTKK